MPYTPAIGALKKVPNRPRAAPLKEAVPLTRRVTGAKLSPGRSYDIAGAIGRMFVEHQLGSGAEGNLYAVRSSRGRGPQALKVVDLARVERRAVSLAFALQRRCAGSLIIKAQLMHVSSKFAFVAFEKAHGPDLEACLLHGVQTKQVTSLTAHLDHFIAMAQAVAHCHSRGVVHRDIKPANFVFAQANLSGLKLTDFGLATEKAKSQPAGTTTYMAPEALRGERVGPEADVWSLGICLYRMIVGIEPHYDDNEALVAAMVLAQSPGYTADDLRLYTGALTPNRSASAAVVTLYTAATEARPERRPNAAVLARFAQRLRRGLCPSQPDEAK